MINDKIKIKIHYKLYSVGVRYLVHKAASMPERLVLKDLDPNDRLVASFTPYFTCQKTMFVIRQNLKLCVKDTNHFMLGTSGKFTNIFFFLILKLFMNIFKTINYFGLCESQYSSTRLTL